LKGRWLGENDGREQEPYVSVEEWDQKLAEAGFGGIEAVHADEGLNVNIVAAAEITERKRDRVTLLCRDSALSEVEDLKRMLVEKAAIWCDVVQLSDGTQIPVEQDVVSMLGVGTPFLHSMEETGFTCLKRVLTSCEGGILWLTGLSSIHCKDPRYSMSLGLARTLRNELDMDFATLELDTFDGHAWGAVADVLDRFLARPSAEEALKQEFRHNME
jgi:hypothetical protein